ncbi:dienelactone hydrolase family protein [Weeksellaceae bacterium TAE3-ERU29]|nr:dienelactone hydrolase family protein [Weeksellaceae bacterium TAE3-ERU29]
MKNYLLLIFISWGVFINAQLSTRTYSVSGREYDVTVPSNYMSTKEYPVVFELHSFGKDKTEMKDQKAVDELQYISVRPEGTKLPKWATLFSSKRGNVWNTWSENKFLTNENDVAYITEVYNDVRSKMGATFNPEKVFVYGFSNGGAMAMKMVQETTLFKAVVVRSMSFVKGHTIPNGAPKVPILFIHGTEDETVPYTGGKGKFGSFSPNFEAVKETAKKWAQHNDCQMQSQDIQYLRTSEELGEFWFREYDNFTVQAPVYLYAVVDAEHGTGTTNTNPKEKTGFTHRNIKRTALRLFKSPPCYGLYQDTEVCKSITSKNYKKSS